MRNPAAPPHEPPYHQGVPVEIRAIEESELPRWIAALQVPFFVAEGDPGQQAALRRAQYDLARCRGAFDGHTLCGTFRSFPTELTVPGPQFVTASAITAVTVLPTHRRQGLLRRMMAADLQASVERGEALSILIASEYPIYGRFGFARAADHVGLSVDASSARFTHRGGGTVELVDRDVLRNVGPGLYERVRHAQVGSITRNDFWWDTTLGIVDAGWPPPKGIRYVLHRDGRGEPQGYLSYHVDEKWEDRVSETTLVVHELLACTDDAYVRLWRYACEVDWVATVKAEDRSIDEALPWLLEDARAVRQQHRTDFLFVRVLDPVTALSARRYLSAGRTVLDVRDEDGYATRRVALETDGSTASCRETRESPDVTLDVRALGAAYLGGTTLATLAAAGLVAESSPGGIARADALLGWNADPWCSTWF